jgi:apolipoprotein D and lipocalin family protein
MKRIITLSFIVILATLSPFAQSGDRLPVKTVPSVDLNKYAGQWYEIAKYPNKFQDQCVGNATANYKLQGAGKIEVLNRCLKKDGTVEDANGAAKLNEDDKSNAKLKVRFAPGFISWLPQVWADYWVIDLADDYSYSVVGTPDRKYFWILSRKPSIDDGTYQSILRRAEQQGFVPAKVVKTPQGVEAGKGAALTKS